MKKLIISYSITPETKARIAKLAEINGTSASRYLDEIVAVQWWKYLEANTQPQSTQTETPPEA